MKVLFFVLIVFIAVIIAVVIRIKIIDAKVKHYPHWIDKSLMPILEKKANVPLIYKMCEVLYFQGNYLEWSNLEKELNRLIEKVKDTTTINFDAIVGIKSGGALLTKYIATQLNIPYYYIKLSDKDYNCKKKPSDVFNDIYKNVIHPQKKIYTICEPIKAELMHKNVLVFDESIHTGNTMVHTLNYLRNEKRVNTVLPITLFSANVTYAGYRPVYLHHMTRNIIWPWGYDN